MGHRSVLVHELGAHGGLLVFGGSVLTHLLLTLFHGSRCCFTGCISALLCCCWDTQLPPRGAGPVGAGFGRCLRIFNFRDHFVYG